MRIYTLDSKNNISGENIKVMRIKCGISQEALAIKLQLYGLQLGQMAVYRTEIRKRAVADFELPITADVLGVSIDWLLNAKSEQVCSSNHVFQQKSRYDTD